MWAWAPHSSLAYSCCWAKIQICLYLEPSWCWLNFLGWLDLGPDLSLHVCLVATGLWIGCTAVTALPCWPAQLVPGWCLSMSSVCPPQILLILPHRAAPAAPWHQHSLKAPHWHEWYSRQFIQKDEYMDVISQDEECRSKSLFWSTVIAEESSSCW